MGTSLTRRAGGLVALVAALLLTLIAPLMLAPDVPGNGSAAALPEPPAIGACVLLEPAGARVRTVPCDQLHDGEVAWAASSRSAYQSLAGSYESQWACAADPAAAADSSCRNWADGYVGTGIAERTNKIGNWQLIPPYWVASIVRGPAADFPERLGWFACVVRPSRNELYLDTVRGDGEELRTRRPGAYATCLAPGELAMRSLLFSSCGQPHSIEFMATLVVTQAMANAGRVDAELTIEQLRRQCADAVSRMTGNPDPTYGGQLTITMETISQRGLQVVAPDPDAATGQLTLPDCLVEVTGDLVLTDSVIGLGESALPLG